MAIGADRPKILHRIDDILAADFRRWSQVVNVNESIGSSSVYGLEAEPTDTAAIAVMLDAPTTSFRITFVSVYGTETGTR